MHAVVRFRKQGGNLKESGSHPVRHLCSLHLRNLAVRKERQESFIKLFMKHPKKVYTKGQIYSSVWKDAYMGDENVKF